MCPALKHLALRLISYRYTGHIVAEMNARDKSTSIGDHQHILIVLEILAEYINIGLDVGLQG